MVKVSESIPQTSNGLPDIAAWRQQVLAEHPRLDSDLVHAATALVGEKDALGSLELAGLIAELNLDVVSVCAGMLYRELRTGRVSSSQVSQALGPEVEALISSVNALASASLLEMSNSRLQDRQQESQVENIKRMLVGMVDDPRVAVVKLAERVIALRRAKGFSETHRQRVASEAKSIFAPLAARLGIGQLKWELEDLAFRYTDEEVYMKIARSLSGKRAERENQVRAIEDRVRAVLRGQGIDAEVVGRAKHIFSIWRKMQAKSVSFDQVYDVRAIRIIVPRLADCYAALGMIHNTWPYIPAEFDDYVANPKENGYQSIHTAVTMEDGHTLEIQIRTEEMHDEAELGVCAHWSYKGEEEDLPQYAEKMDWLRQVMEWHDELGGSENLSTLLAHRASDDRIYVSTPKGHVLDLPRHSTVLDFAYRVHTDLGHACRGATVNGQTATLDRPLENSDQVEVVIDEEAPGPRRDWMEKGLGFVHTDRARAKIVSYFRSLPDDEKEALGRTLLDQAIKMLELTELTVEQRSKLETEYGVEEGRFFIELGCGQLSLFDVLEGLVARDTSRHQPELPGVASDTLAAAPSEPIDGDASARFEICAANRDGLLHDITQTLQRLGLTLSATTGRVNEAADQAIIRIETRVEGWRGCLQLACHLRLIRGVVEVTRA